MKQSKIIISVTVAAVLLSVVLLVAFVFGLYIRRVRQQRSTIESVAVSKAVTELKTEEAEIRPGPPNESRRSPRTISSEQRELLGEQIEDIKRRWANMSEEERQEFKGKMLEMFDARRREAGRRSAVRPPEEEARFRDEIMLTKKRWEDMSDEERQEFRNKMRERANAIRQGND